MYKYKSIELRNKMSFGYKLILQTFYQMYHVSSEKMLNIAPNKQQIPQKEKTTK